MMIPKIILINPPTSRDQFATSYEDYFPTGLMSLSVVLKEKGMDVKLIDINNIFYGKKVNERVLNNYIKNELFYHLTRYKPDIIGIGCLFSGLFGNLKIIAKSIKENNDYKEIPIVIGGIHPTLFARDILRKYSYIDYIVIGESEFTFLELIKHLTNSSRSLKDIDGIAYRDNGLIKLNPKTKFIDSLDSLPFIDYSMINIDGYNTDTSNWYSPKGIKVGKPFPILSSRSCPHRCNFCSMWLVHGTKFRYRSPENVLDEMELLYKKYNARYFHFMDDNLTFNKERMMEICLGIQKRNMNIQFDTPNGVSINRLDNEIISKMVDVGWVHTSLAIESGSEYIRNQVIKKGLSTKKIYEVVEACLKHDNLFVKGFFIVGFPEETHETLQDTYEMIKRMPLDNFKVGFVVPYPGTALYKTCLEHNLLPEEFKDAMNISGLHGLSDRPFFKPFNLTIEELLSFRNKCYDILKARRMASNLPVNYPLRCRYNRS